MEHLADAVAHKVFGKEVTALNEVHAALGSFGELIVAALIKNMFITFPPPDNIAAERYHRFFLAGAFYNVFIEWLKGGLTEDCATMARICADMATNGCPTPFDEVERNDA